MKVLINKVSSQEELSACLNIRMLVFVKGQKVSLEDEQDGQDAKSQHYLLTVDGKPVGVARIRVIEQYAKIERVAILDSYQNKGLGKQLMEAILADLKLNPAIHSARLGSQTHAIAFYERLGFVISSEEYLDAGIPHKDMQCTFTTDC
jgi:predicted GNAT family N-acyltransferase